MMGRFQPHREILLTALRQVLRNTERWLIALLVLLCIVPNALAWWFQPGKVAGLVTLFTLAVLLQALWVAQLSSLMQQNHPTAARLVPGQLRRLRESLVAVFVAVALATAALLGPILGHGLAWALAASVLMLVVGVMVRRSPNAAPRPRAQSQS